MQQLLCRPQDFQRNREKLRLLAQPVAIAVHSAWVRCPVD